MANASEIRQLMNRAWRTPVINRLALNREIMQIIRNNSNLEIESESKNRSH